MSSPEAVSERQRYEIHDNVILDGGDQSDSSPAGPGVIAGTHDPCHWGGIACLLNNSDPDVSATVTVHDSPDAAIWTMVPFSVSNQGGLLQFTICPLGQKQVLFDSHVRYIRITVSPWNPSGVQAVLQQHVPRSRIYSGPQGS